MPGWERIPEWSDSNKVYTSPGEQLLREPLEEVPESERHTYEMKFDKTINLFVSPGDAIEITRIFKGNYVKHILAIKFPGGLDAWVNSITKELCELNWNRTNSEVGGGFVKPSIDAIEEGLKECDIKIEYKLYTPPVKCPESVKDVLRYWERLKREAKGKRKANIQKTIDRIKKEYNCP